ncbi:MAG: hypothetical protein C4576_06805 [Desulfobacteraceae bacterium]|nr:MAG: hypothetical protein C4576_06805 [Desulfobacteraceae bacterium]
MHLRAFTIYNILERNARSFPNGVAFCGNHGNVSHGQFKDRVDELSFGLIKRGLTKGDRIGVVAKNSLEYFILLGAAAKTGGLVVPINWRFSQQEIEYVLSDSSPAFVFADPEYQDMLLKIGSKAPSVKEWFSIDEKASLFSSFNALMEDQQGKDGTKVSPDDPFVIIYTAAVSGRPRGAVLTHRNILSANVEYAVSLRLGEEDAHLTTTPLYHIAGLGLSFGVMHAGGKNIIIPKFDKETVATCIEQHKATVMASFPPILANLLDEANESSKDLSSLRWVLGIDQQDTIKRLETKTNATFVLGYGQTEVTGVISLGTSLQKPGSVGKGGFLTDIRIVDEKDNEVEPGEGGEIVIRGPSVFAGYWNCEDETEYTLRNEWHHTGDLCKRDRDGFLWFVGRKAEKELIKPGGENVYPVEVEKIIAAHPAIREVCVIGVPDREWGEAIKAICVLEPGHTMSEDELREFVAARISRIKKPKYVAFVPELSRGRDGLVDRAKIKAHFGKV